MKTTLCHVLGIEHPIIAAPMGPDLTGPDLVAAVSDAGGLGILQAQLCPPPLFRAEIRRVRRLTDKPFGVNLIRQGGPLWGRLLRCDRPGTLQKLLRQPRYRPGTSMDCKSQKGVVKFLESYR